MPRPPSSAVQIAIRVPAEWLEEAERLAPKLSRPGMSNTRSDVLRAAMAKGLEALRVEVEGTTATTPAAKASRKKT